jgi:Zn-dependent protease with chaperone function
MNFFESQDKAKRNTGKLVFLFAMAVLSLIVITNVIVLAALGMLSTQGSGVQYSNQAALQSVGVVTGGVLVVIVLGSLYKMMALAGGGARVAEMLNGRLLLPESSDPHERRVLNVVEEMALASGTPVPPVYLLEEPGINAFAAGYSPGDAVIGITRGAIESFSRDELQGVIGHEFSHILHGDMRINIRLIAILHGILILGILGYYLLRGGAIGRRSKDSGGIVALGLGLMVVGYVGTFFGNLIKAAVSRQREFLADASAVQYTRNPEGIAGALMRIATHDGRSYLNNPSSMEISHALFEEGMVSRLGRLYATHPPLDQRIKAILPSWDGNYDLPEVTRYESGEDDQDKPSSSSEKAESILTGLTTVLVADAIINQVGQTDNVHLEQARQLLQSIPQGLLSAAHSPSSARAMVYWLMLDSDETEKQQQLEFLEQSADAGIFLELTKLLNEHPEVNSEHRLPLLQIATSSLRQLSKPQYTLFKTNIDKLIRLDGKINLFEWALQKIVTKNLDQIFDRSNGVRLGSKEIGRCKKSLEVLFSILSVSDSSDQQVISLNFSKAAEALNELGVSGLTLVEKSAISFEKLNAALDELAQLKPLQKPALLKACVACIIADNKVAPIELELLRAIGATLECPIPPVIA